MYFLKIYPTKINEALSNACEGGHINLIEDLILMGASDWDEAFLGACRGKHIALVKEMIYRGVRILNRGLVLVCDNRSKAPASLELAKLLIEKGADSLDSALQMICLSERCNLKIMKLLVCNGAGSFNIAMERACRYGNLIAAKF